MRNLTGTERFNRQIVQVSVARQVSVSKARRRVADAVEVKQPLRPRVVELGKNRKSTLVICIHSRHRFFFCLVLYSERCSLSVVSFSPKRGGFLFFSRNRKLVFGAGCV
jgi:hypothetical protein